MKLAGQVALITAGAGAGIGRASARALAAEGADVVVTDIHERRTRETAEALSAELGRPVLGLPLDVTDEEAVATTIAEIEERKGGIDIILNNAARNKTRNAKLRLPPVAAGGGIPVSEAADEVLSETALCGVLFARMSVAG